MFRMEVSIGTVPTVILQWFCLGFVFVLFACFTIVAEYLCQERNESNQNQNNT